MIKKKAKMKGHYHKELNKKMLPSETPSCLHQITVKNKILILNEFSTIIIIILKFKKNDVCLLMTRMFYTFDPQVLETSDLEVLYLWIF